VRFVAPDAADELIDRPGAVTWLTIDDVAELLRDLKQDNTAWLGRGFTGQFSLAGAQAKTALLYRDGRWGVPSGAAATTHILKPAVAGLDEHDLNEHLCMDGARRVGLIAARTEIARFHDQTAIVVQRYDRRIRDDRLIRIHQEDMCQGLGLPPSRKYQNEGGPSPGDIACLLRQTMPTRIADEAVLRFADALAWNWLIAGTDAHAKNYSLLLSGAGVRLAPLYDLASALPYNVHERRLRFAMKIGGDYRVYPYQNTWRAAATEVGLEPELMLQRVKALSEVAADAFRDAAATPSVVELGSALPSRLVDLVADRVVRCRRLLDTSGGSPTRTIE